MISGIRNYSIFIPCIFLFLAQRKRSDAFSQTTECTNCTWLFEKTPGMMFFKDYSHINICDGVHLHRIVSRDEKVKFVNIMIKFVLLGDKYLKICSNICSKEKEVTSRCKPRGIISGCISIWIRTTDFPSVRIGMLCLGS